ncbi:hypothetical protein ACQ4LE_011198 [Meloidogyne hapla]|uniref:Uncharacterized protein n=1 Tax=Meloidogyne hapla TaxID=6305 RepID=A0A1I8B1V9_MELHA
MKINTKFFSFQKLLFTITTLFTILQLFVCKVESFDYEIRQFGPSSIGSNSGIAQRSLFVDTETNSDDNAGFLGGLPVSSRRRLIQPPPLKRSLGINRGQRILVGNDWPILLTRPEII